jgi:hypothetical protein
MSIYTLIVHIYKDPIDGQANLYRETSFTVLENGHTIITKPLHSGSVLIHHPNPQTSLTNIRRQSKHPKCIFPQYTAVATTPRNPRVEIRSSQLSTLSSVGRHQ